MAAVAVAEVAAQLPVDTIICGDALEVLRSQPDASVDAIVTDPPAGIAFMGKDWDRDKGGRDAWIAWLSEVMAEALRVVKPGGHALVWALPRTSHWTATALEDAGWDVRDIITHHYGSGFPKSLNVSKQLDKMAGAQRAKVRPVAVPARNRNGTNALGGSWQEEPWQEEPWETAPATDAAKQWSGYGTALKPSSEHWILCRKPLVGTVAENVLAWGTGALNVDACRVQGQVAPKAWAQPRGGIWRTDSKAKAEMVDNTAGRWPPNLVFTHSATCGEETCAEDCPVRVLGEQSGECKSGGYPPAGGMRSQLATYGKPTARGEQRFTASEGTAACFFPTFRYQAKASRRERNAGCEGLPVHRSGYRPNDPDENKLQTRLHGSRERGGNGHPTVKPLALMSWLITLITPPGGIVLDCFAGSGTTLVAAKAGGWHFIGVEREAEYVQIAEARLAATATEGERR